MGLQQWSTYYNIYIYKSLKHTVSKIGSSFMLMLFSMMSFSSSFRHRFENKVNCMPLHTNHKQFIGFSQHFLSFFCSLFFLNLLLHISSLLLIITHRKQMLLQSSSCFSFLLTHNVVNRTIHKNTLCRRRFLRLLLALSRRRKNTMRTSVGNDKERNWLKSLSDYPFSRNCQEMLFEEILLWSVLV